MAATPDTFAQWLAQAHLCEATLTADQRAVLQAAFRFRQSQGTDYYSTRLLSHFLLHCHAGLKVAQVARLVGVSRPTASRQQGLSAKEAIQQAHHRMDGRPYGKLLPRYAGPIAQFLCTNPTATRYDLLDFIAETFGVRASRIALYKFLKKYGLDQVPAPDTTAVPPAPGPPRTTPVAAPAPAPAPPFCSGTRPTPAPSC
jgi:transposase